MPNHFNPVRYLYNSKMHFNHCVAWSISISPLFIQFIPLEYQPKEMFIKLCLSKFVLYFNFYIPSPISQKKKTHKKSMLSISTPQLLIQESAIALRRKVTPDSMITCFGFSCHLNIALKMLIHYYLADMLKILKKCIV